MSAVSLIPGIGLFGIGAREIAKIPPSNVFTLDMWNELMGTARPSGQASFSLEKSEDSLSITVDSKYITSGTLVPTILGWSWATNGDPPNSSEQWKLHRPNTPVQHPYLPWLRADALSVDYSSPFAKLRDDGTYKAKEDVPVVSGAAVKYGPSAFGRYGRASVTVRFTDQRMQFYTDDDNHWKTDLNGKEYYRNFGFANISPKAEAVSVTGATGDSTMYFCDSCISYVVSSASWSTGVVSATTATAHGFVTGNSVSINSALATAATNANYNGVYTVTVTGATTFTYAKVADPGSYTSNGSNARLTVADVIPPLSNGQTPFQGDVYTYKNSASYEMLWRCVPESYLCNNLTTTNSQDTTMPEPSRLIQSLGTVNSTPFPGNDSASHPAGTLLFEALQVKRYRMPIILKNATYVAYAWDVYFTFSKFDPKRPPDSVWKGVPPDTQGNNPVPAASRLRGWNLFPWRASNNGYWYAATRGAKIAASGNQGTYSGKPLIETTNFNNLFEHVNNPNYPLPNA